MSIVTLEYTGTTPGADSNTYVLFSTVAAGAPGNWAPMCSLHSFHYNIKHSQAGTVKGYKSSNRGTSWTQFFDSGSIAAPTYVTNNVVSIEGFQDFKFEWVNGGSAQATWAVDMNLSTSA